MRRAILPDASCLTGFPGFLPATERRGDRCRRGCSRCGSTQLPGVFFKAQVFAQRVSEGSEKDALSPGHRGEGGVVSLRQAGPRPSVPPDQGECAENLCPGRGLWNVGASGGCRHPGGSRAVKKAGWPFPGRIKHDRAGKIGPCLDPGRNLSPSFCKFRDGLVRLAEEGA